jgi:cell filamentation protein
LSQEANIQGDPYLYPGTSVLRNLADIRDTNHLNQFESDHFFARLLELYESPIHGSFDSDHLRHIHQHLFQDVYAWAGEFRTVPIAKGNSFFARPEHIRAELQKLFHQLAGEQYLRGIDSKGFCQRAALPWRDQCFASFSRGKRTSAARIHSRAGYEIAWDLVTQDEMFTASVASFHGGISEAFSTILNKIIRPVR